MAENGSELIWNDGDVSCERKRTLKLENESRQPNLAENAPTVTEMAVCARKWIITIENGRSQSRTVTGVECWCLQVRNEVWGEHEHVSPKINQKRPKIGGCAYVGVFLTVVSVLMARNHVVTL